MKANKPETILSARWYSIEYNKYTKILEVNLFAFAYRLYKNSPLSTLPLVIPEYIWIEYNK